MEHGRYFLLSLVHGRIAALLIILISVLVYSGAIGNGYIWDDDEYVHQNPLIRTSDGLAKIWTSLSRPEYDPESSTPQYYPLVFTTYYLEHKLWGLDPGGYHLTNVLLHTASAVLLFLLLKRLGVGPVVSWVTAVLFAVHPVQVESVAWITERKNVLSAVFYFAAFISFQKHKDTEKFSYYLGSLLLFILALLSKTVTASLPAVLLLAGYVRGRLGRRTVLKVAPFFVAGMLMGLVTAILERQRVNSSAPPPAQ